MRYSKLFGKTRYNPPCDADSNNARYLTQAGFVDKVGAGIYNYLPLGHRVLSKIAKIIREEMSAVDSQEIMMPVLHPIAFWEKTGRDRTMDDVLFRTTGAGSKDFVMGPSHEEMITPLVANYVQSYKHLPLSLYQIQLKFRNEPRAKSGVLRGREFGMKDMYSFHTTEEDLDEYYARATKAYINVFERCGVKAYVIEASGGAFSDKFSHEFSVETPAGEDTIILCDKCGFAQNLEVATGKVVEVPTHDEELPLKMVEVEHGPSVSENAKAHAAEESHILKTVVYEVDEDGLVGVVIRGDLSVNQVKLERYFGKPLRPASAQLLKDAGLIPGYISPVNLPDKVNLSFVADHSIKNIKNFITGANINNTDYINVNVGRDFIIADFADFVEVSSGFACENCGDELRELKAIEAGNIFKLGTKYSEAFGLNYTDKDGISKPVVMGCYGIGTTRLLGTIAEVFHDDKGLIWPKSVSPFDVTLISLSGSDEVDAAAEKMYQDLKDAGVDVLFDDRDDRPGVKFTDADLIGVPVRIVISKRTLENKSVEWKLRSSEKSENVEIESLVKKVKEFVK